MSLTGLYVPQVKVKVKEKFPRGFPSDTFDVIGIHPVHKRLKVDFLNSENST